MAINYFNFDSVSKEGLFSYTFQKRIYTEKNSFKKTCNCLHISCLQKCLYIVKALIFFFHVGKNCYFCIRVKEKHIINLKII